MKNYFEHVRLLIWRLLVALLAFSVSRGFFLALNLEYFYDLSVVEAVKLFVFGMQFDVGAVVYLNIFFIVLHLIPGDFKEHRLYQRLLFGLFLAINAFLLLFNYIDAKYFSFTNKRSTADLFRLIGYGDDVQTLLPQFIKDFWYVVLAWIATIALLWWLYPKLKKQTASTQRVSTPIMRSVVQYVMQTLVSLCVMTILFFAARGIGLKPISPLTAARYTTARNIPLVLNTPFTIMRTLFKQDLEMHHYFDDQQLRDIYTPVIQPVTSEPFRPDNVIVIIVESFSREYIGALNGNEGYTPFLDDIIADSLVFDQAFANGKKSMEAMPAILAGLPTLMDNPYISSSFSSDQINSLASLLKQKQYHTSFFHGGTNGTMGFDNFAHIAGFELYYGRKEYNNDKDFDGNWGIWDEEFLLDYVKQLSTFPEPFFSSVFTLSSHHPYSIPERYANDFAEGPLKIHRSVRYTDFALRRFFEAASHTSWFEHTLFVITADHTAQAVDPQYATSVGIYELPLIFYKPSDPNMSGRRSTIAQQIDIMPSILDYLNYDLPYLAFGTSVFDNTARHVAVSYLSGVYQLIENEYVLTFDGERSLALYNWRSDRLLTTNLLTAQPEIAAELETYLKAFIQSYNNRLIHNQLTVPDS